MPFTDRAELGSSAAALKLLENKVPSRIAAQDASVFSFSPEAEACAAMRLGWVSLASDPPIDPSEIEVLAQQARCEHLEAVVLIGQGGSTQAAQTITKLRSLELKNEIPFRTMDSLSPVYVNHILGSSNPAKTLYIVSSKSGTTLEPTVLSHVAWKYVSALIGKEHAGSRFIAVTDAGSKLEQVARKNNWRAVFTGPANVGGRYSALSVFGLLPMACVGIDVEKALADVCETEASCGADSPDNPALQLASFLYDNWQRGRDKFSLICPPSRQVFGLWVEQLVAESLGKQGFGILPNIETDPGILADPHTDRCAVLCNMGNEQAFELAKACLHPEIPTFRLDILDSSDMAGYFLIWEYAIAFTGWLMKINPFDQPDVESTKIATRQLLGKNGGAFTMPSDPLGRDAYKEFKLDDPYIDSICVSSALLDTLVTSRVEMDAGRALRALFRSIKPGDYFSLNAFLPFRGVGRRETLERIRHRVADRLHACSCLEIGPRYLHSTGQLHKGGPDTGVFLVVSSAEPYDIKIPHEKFTLGGVEKAEAMGDFSALASRGRRALYVHLRDNDSKYLQALADAACQAISAAYAIRAH